SDEGQGDSPDQLSGGQLSESWVVPAAGRGGSMEYKSISADGHVNEPPTLWVENLPQRVRHRRPRVIETPNTKGHAWIMEGQKRPSVMGFSSMYFRSSKRFDRASLVEGFKQIKDRGVRYEDLFPGSYDPAARVGEILEDSIDAEVIFNGV